MADLSKVVSIIFRGDNQANDAINQVGSGLDKARSSADLLAGALKAAAGSIVVAEFIQANSAIEQYKAAMEAATGSSEKAAAEWDYIKGVANRLGIEVQSSAAAFASFAGATKGTALEGEGAKQIFEAIAGTMSRLGRSSEDTAGVLTQLSQGVSKGKFELEDLKSIAERIPGFFTSFAQSLGVSTDKLFEMISAGQITGDEFLKFAQTLNQGLDGVKFDSFNANLARFKNETTFAFEELGKAGVWDLVIKGVQGATAAIAGAVAYVTGLGEIIGKVIAAVATRNFEGLGSSIDESLQNAANKVRGASEAFFNFNQEATKATGPGGTGAAAGQAIADGMGKAGTATDDAKKEAGKFNEALKGLGIDPKKFTEPVKDIGDSFKALVDNKDIRPDQIMTAFEAAIKKVKDTGDLNQVGEALTKAFSEGKISADQFKVATGELASANQKLQKQLGNTDDIKKNEEAIRRQAAETQKAKERAEQFKLEMEKLASNERIKAIEAKVSLDIANVEANAKIVQAAFESVNTAIESSGDVLKGLFGELKEADKMQISTRNKLFEQLDKENKRRDEAFKLQKKLTEATIEQMRATTEAMKRGDAMIKIDGKGLQPHLEAFMWEILKAIQVKVNQDGLKMLLGT